MTWINPFSTAAIGSGSGQSSSVVVIEPLTIKGSTSDPTKATTREMDFIRVADDGAGWCRCDMRYSALSAAGAALGSGTYLIQLPGGYKFDTSVHAPNTQIGSMNGADQVNLIVAGSDGFMSDSATVNRCVAVPHSGTLFKVMSMEALGGAVGRWSYWSSGLWTLTSNKISVSLSFRFKTG